MLAAKAVDSKLKFPAKGQPKYDGIRAAVTGGKLLTRTLKEVPNREIFEALSRPEFEGLDGELIVGSPTHADCYRTSVSFVMSRDETGADWAYYVFDKWDAIGVVDLETGAEEPPGFTERYEQLVSTLLTIHRSVPSDLSARFRLVPTTDVADAEALEAFEAECIAEGHEGVILRDPDGLYKYGRATANQGQLIKLKRFSDSEAEVIGIEEEMYNGNEATVNALGRTERSSHKANKVGKGTMGKLLVRDCNPESEFFGVEFAVGTGFTAAERQEWWDEAWNEPTLFHPDLPPVIIRYKYFAVGIKDKPRHPVYLGLRYQADMPQVA